MVAMGDDWATYVEGRRGDLEFTVSLAYLKSIDLICFFDTQYEDAELTQRGYQLASELGFTDEPPGAYVPHCSEPTFADERKDVLRAPEFALGARFTYADAYEDLLRKRPTPPEDDDGKLLVVRNGPVTVDGYTDGDETWYTLEVDPLDGNTNSYIIRTTGIVQEPILDTALYLFDADNNEIGYDDDGGTGVFSELREDLEVGRYRLGVGSYDERDGSYRLTVVALDVDREGQRIIREQARESAEPLIAGVELAGALESGGERVYSFTLDESAAGRYTIATSAPESGARVDTVLSLYRYENGIEELVGEDDDSGNDLFYSTLRESLQEGTYYAHVRGFRGYPGGFRVLVSRDADE